MARWRASDMDSKICLVLCGIITLTNGRPATDQTSYIIANENELQSLLKTLYSQGKFDIAFSHHEDGPKSHHEDRARIYHHDDSSLHHQHEPHAEVKYSHGHKERPSTHKHTNIEEHPSLTNIQTLNLYYRKKPIRTDKGSDDTDDSDIETLLGLSKHKKVGRIGDNNVDVVLDLLKEVDDTLAGDRIDDRCEGDRCGKDRDENNERADCKGDRCGRGRSDNNDRADCQGDRCGKDDRDDCQDDRCGSDNRADCQGDRCTRGRSEKYDSINDRDSCNGDRCSRDRSNTKCQGSRCDDGRNNDDDRADCRDDRCTRTRSGSYRDEDRRAECNGNRCRIEARSKCIGDRCSKGRSENIRDERDDDDRIDCRGNRCGSDRGNDRADCTGDRCGKNTYDTQIRGGGGYGLNRNDNDRIACIGERCSGDREDDDDNKNYDSNLLRCFGDGCGISDNKADCIGDVCGREDDADDGDTDDKVVLRCFGDGCGRDNIDRTDLRERRLPEGDENIKRQILAYGNKIKLNDEYDAIVLDLSDLNKFTDKPQPATHGDDQQNTLQLIDNIDLDNLLQNNKNGGSKSASANPIEAIVVDLSRSQNELSKEIKELVTDVQTPIKKNKHQKASKGQGESKILPHNQDNNNVYVPKWLLDEVASKTSLRDISAEHISQENVLPLSPKQKEKLLKVITGKSKQKPSRIFRRSVENDIGVPFHLEIQGLGQVNP